MAMLRSSVRARTIVLSCVLAALLFGCQPDSGFSRFGDQMRRSFWGTPHEDVGSTHLAVLSVTRWDDYKKQLQPTFEFTEKEALKMAVADTMQMDQSVLNALVAHLGLKLAPSDVLPAGFKETDQNVPEPNASSAHAGSTGPKNSADVAVDPHMAYLAATALYQEVKLLNRYVADAAIEKGYKAYIVRAQIACMPSKRGLPYDTYVDIGFFLDDIRVSGSKSRITAMVEGLRDDAAKSKSQGRDRDISDERGGTQQNTRAAAQGAGDTEMPLFERFNRAKAEYADIIRRYKATMDYEPFPAMQNAIQELSAVQDELEEIIRASGTEKTYVVDDAQRLLREVDEKLQGCYRLLEPGYVIPLLVTDQVEAALLSRRAETLRQMVLALSAAYAGVGGKASVDQITNLVESSLGRNYNSLCTVARASDNTLRVRLGARQSPGSHSYEMVPQTHNVSLLLFVPDWCVKDDELPMYVASRTKFTYCETGQPALVEKGGVEGSVKKRLLAAWKVGADRDTEDCLRTLGKCQTRWDKLVTDVANEDYESFAVDLLEQRLKDRALINRMWFDLSGWVSNEYDKTTFAVPKYPDPDPQVVNGSDQTVILADDGKTTSATIVGVKDIDPEKVSAVWHVQHRPKAQQHWWEFLGVTWLQKAAIQQYEFAATGAALAQGNQNLVVTFPSLAALDVVPEPLSGCGADSRICLYQATREGDRTRVALLPWIYQRVPAVKQNARITVEVVQEQLSPSVDKENAQPRFLLVGFARSEKAGKKDDITGYKMAVSGGYVKEVKGTAITAVSDKAQVYTIDSVGQVVLQLTELVAGQPVKLTFSAPEGYEAPPAREIKVNAPPGK